MENTVSKVDIYYIPKDVLNYMFTFFIFVEAVPCYFIRLFSTLPALHVLRRPRYNDEYKSIIHYVCKQGYIPLVQWTVDFLIQNSSFYTKQICELAAAYNNFELLLWAREKPRKYALSVHTFANAASNGNIEMLRYLRQQECDTSYACISAASKGHLEILKWLRCCTEESRNYELCSWDDNMFSVAAYNGHLEILQWASQNEPPLFWSNEILLNAIAGGHLHILLWAHNQRNDTSKVVFAWADRRLCNAAARSGKLEILQWLRLKDPTIEKVPCIWDKWVCYDAATSGNLNILRWALDNGAPVHTLDRARYELEFIPGSEKYSIENPFSYPREPDD